MDTSPVQCASTEDKSIGNVREQYVKDESHDNSSATCSRGSTSIENVKQSPDHKGRKSDYQSLGQVLFASRQDKNTGNARDQALEMLNTSKHVDGNLKAQYDGGESSFSAGDHVTYSGPIPFSGSLSLRSDSSAATSTRSFAFPVLQSDWNISPDLEIVMAVFVVFFLIFLGMTVHSDAAYCICNDGLSDPVLQRNIDYACGAGADCTPIVQNGPCFQPNTVKDHCNYAVNSYYQRKGQVVGSCNFSNTATVTPNVPPAAPGCVYPSSPSNTGPSPTPLTPGGTPNASSGTPMTPFPGSNTPPSFNLAPSGVGFGNNDNGASVTLYRSPEIVGIPALIFLPSDRIFLSDLKMYVVESKGGAIGCMFLSLFFLGTWPAIMTLLERRGRLPQHTYLDYTLTNLLAAVIIAFTFGEIGNSTIEKPNFLNQLSQDNWPSVLFAMAGGGCPQPWKSGDSICLGICRFVSDRGTTLNYFLDDKINSAEILFPGVGCFLIAVSLGSAVHASNAADNKEKLTSFSNDTKDGAKIKDAPISNETNANNDTVIKEDLENGLVTKEKAKFGTAHFLIELENKRAIKVFGKGTLIGLAITFFAGFCFSLFSPAFNLATNDQWHTLKAGVHHLSVYTAFFYFSVSCFVIAVILNINFLYRPVLNLPKSSIRAYLSDWNGRGWALLAGLLCGFGNGLQFMGGQAAGYAAADAVQALPLVSTFWGILLFGEYRRSSRRTYVLLVGMLLMFIVAVGVLMASSGHRK
ncbi:Ureide permease 1 [Abeliophyllum distichum]|uniref:Ureide permease 1 n=1 Tax=Abeliophyllum distichum TaxID=126358 RepID=A0ABD1R8I0_9LAMI